MISISSLDNMKASDIETLPRIYQHSRYNVSLSCFTSPSRSLTSLRILSRGHAKILRRKNLIDQMLLASHKL